MGEEITFYPSFTGVAEWFEPGERDIAFCICRIDRAIYRDHYKNLTLSFRDPNFPEGPLAVGGLKELTLNWSGDGFQGGVYPVSYDLKPKFPDIADIRGSWFVRKEHSICTKTGRQIFSRSDEEYIVSIKLSPLRINETQS